MDIKQEVVFDNGASDLSFSLRKQSYIEVNGEKQYIGKPERLGVIPGQFAEVEDFAPELMPAFQAMWTDEVVAAQEAIIAEAINKRAEARVAFEMARREHQKQHPDDSLELQWAGAQKLVADGYSYKKSAESEDYKKRVLQEEMDGVLLKQDN